MQQRTKNRRIALNQQSYLKAKTEIGFLSKRDRFVAGIALYTGEGDKGRYKSTFTYSDSTLVRFMMGWFKEFCKVPLEKFRGAIWIHEGNDQFEAKKYWSELTGIAEDKFH